MFNDNSVMLGIIGVGVYLVVMIVAMVISYLIMKAAVKNGTLAALRRAKTERLIP